MDETSAKCSSETLRIKIFYLSFLSDSQIPRSSFRVQSKKLPVFVFSLSNLTGRHWFHREDNIPGIYFILEHNLKLRTDEISLILVLSKIWWYNYSLHYCDLWFLNLMSFKVKIRAKHMCVFANMDVSMSSCIIKKPFWIRLLK